MILAQSYLSVDSRSLQGYGGQWLILDGAETVFEIDSRLVICDLSLQISIKHFYVLIAGLGPMGYEEINKTWWLSYNLVNVILGTKSLTSTGIGENLINTHLLWGSI